MTTPLLSALDHAVLLCPDIDTGTEALETLFGRAADWCAVDEAGGTASALFRFANTALELLAPHGTGPRASDLAERVCAGEAGLASLVFAAPDIGAAHHRLARRGLDPDAVTDGASTDLKTGATRRWKRFRCSGDHTAGARVFVIQPEDTLAPAPPSAPGAVDALDHLVIETPAPGRALALYGARLGLDLALDRTAPEWKTRFLFFRVGGLTLEIVQHLDQPTDPAAPDRLWGLTWRTGDLDAAHARLSAAGLDLSAIRTGRKPGTRVFTVRSGTLSVPTLFLEQAGR